MSLDDGVVRWGGAQVGPATRPQFGYTPEERGRYPRMRAREQLVYLGRLCGRSSPDAARCADRWLERFALADRAGDRLDTLSHRNQQRVQLIAELVNEPELLVLDEPFSGLEAIAALDPDWSALAGVHLVYDEPGHARLRVDADADLPAVAALAQHAGVVSFTYQPPTLSEMFRQVVTA